MDTRRKRIAITATGLVVGLAAIATALVVERPRGARPAQCLAPPRPDVVAGRLDHSLVIRRVGLHRGRRR